MGQPYLQLHCGLQGSKGVAFIAGWWYLFRVGALFGTSAWIVMALFIGKVVGTKMQKTAKVEVTRMFLHPQVLKVNPFTRSGNVVTCYNTYTIDCIL